MSNPAPWLRPPDEDVGAGTIRQFLRTGLVDELHVAIVPIFLGGGERLFDDLNGAMAAYECVELVSSPSVVHVRLARKGGPPAA